MKVYVRNALANPEELSGKGLFCCRLSKALMTMEIEMTADTTASADVSVNVIAIENDIAKVRIVRLDGVYHNTGMNYLGKNKRFRDNLFASDGVVFQSKFSEQMCEKYLGHYKGPRQVIHNGTDPEYYKSVLPAKIKEKNVFVAFARWRPHKRLTEIIECFLQANIEDSVLIIGGDLKKSRMLEPEQKKYFNLPNVRYLGKLSQREMASYYRIAKASLHLCWVDWCPNSVVEALVANVPVICGNVGGTSELVECAGGIICNIDKPYDKNPMELYVPPAIDRNIVVNAIRKCAAGEVVVNSNKLYIDYIAKQYLAFMQRVLKTKGVKYD